MNIRLVQGTDALAISQILRGLGFFAYLNAETEAATAQRVAKHIALCQQDDSHTVFVAENDQGVVVGYIALHWLPYLMLKAPEGYVSELFIAKTESGQGIGSQLLAHAVAEARKRGCARLCLRNLRTRESYQRGFYKKQGWVERDEVAHFALQLIE
jgi:GNAT superfamily N-acetyltransferase